MLTIKFALLLSFASMVSALYSSNSAVTQIKTKEEFKNLVLKSDSVVFVEFYAPWCGHCKNLAPEWEKAAKALKGVVTIAAVDASEGEGQSIGQKYGVQGFPTIKVFSGKTSNPTDYNGARESSGIVSAAMKEVKSLVDSRVGGKSSGSSSKSSDSKKDGKKKGGSGSKDEVITLTDSNFEELVINSDDIWLVEFYAPWCGHCKALAPEWKKAAGEMAGRVKFGALDATAEQNIASQFNIKGYPTIKYFSAGAKTMKSAKDYEQQRTADALVQFATKLADEQGAPAAKLEIKQITSSAIVDEQCEGKTICVVAFLPNILDSKASGRNDYIAKFEKAAGSAKRGLFTFSWSEGGAQKELEKALRINPADLPTAVAIHRGKGKFSKQRGAFTESALKEFFTSMISGSANVLSLPETFPKIVDVKGWDGKDGKLEVEEEFSLDDIMGEL